VIVLMLSVTGQATLLIVSAKLKARLRLVLLRV